MCGIVYCEGLNGDPVNKLVNKLFQNQKHRGTEGFGFYDKNTGRLHRATKERKILSKLRNNSSSSVLFHHRFPTSTDNVRNACHPFSTMRYFDTNYVLVHNGWITNASELKAEHEKLGITYYSTQPDGRFNDSEALLWDVALYLEGKQDELKAEGAIAFICMARGKKDDKLFFARNTNPLNMKLDNNFLMLSSEGEGEAIQSHQLYEFDYATTELQQKALTVPSYTQVVYPDYSPHKSNSYTYGGYATGYYEDEYEDELELASWNASYGYYGSLDDEKELKNDIQTVYTVYAKKFDGVFELIYNCMELEVQALREQIKAEETDFGFTPPDLVYSVQVLKSAMNILLDDYAWLDENSVMPEYQVQELPLKELKRIEG